MKKLLESPDPSKRHSFSQHDIIACFCGQAFLII
nr:MAG TPA: hypothetical protein [Caudoviricetes sp.]